MEDLIFKTEEGQMSYLGFSREMDTFVIWENKVKT